ncbi:uncharacterized protein DSM5745_09156 [Aspergillus mulundensis]|uniref:Uncharacterized protein n=1 Tax=Aspergillus mulundensis TaxID=1810919 RepID=A0A3D8R052_9EURO|nr:hypothetical protein DSM5745_09156 [Aspergillus mulundensis]RDW67290.1 hypothetical protein DSM5745_09156 [Aspergillus mulundensis]
MSLSNGELRRRYPNLEHQYVPEETSKQSRLLYIYHSGVDEEQTALKVASEYIEWFRNAGCKTFAIRVGYIHLEHRPGWAIFMQLTKPEEGYGENWLAELKAKPRKDSEFASGQIPAEGFFEKTNIRFVLGPLPLMRKYTHLIFYKDVPFLISKHVRMHGDEASWALLWDMLNKGLRGEPDALDKALTARMVEFMRERQLTWAEMKPRFEELLPRVEEIF